MGRRFCSPHLVWAARGYASSNFLMIFSGAPASSAWWRGIIPSHDDVALAKDGLLVSSFLAACQSRRLMASDKGLVWTIFSVAYGSDSNVTYWPRLHKLIMKFSSCSAADDANDTSSSSYWLFVSVVGKGWSAVIILKTVLDRCYGHLLWMAWRGRLFSPSTAIMWYDVTSTNVMYHSDNRSNILVVWTYRILITHALRFSSL